jgi:hypothetical protein
MPGSPPGVPLEVTWLCGDSSRTDADFWRVETDYGLPMLLEVHHRWWLHADAPVRLTVLQGGFWSGVPWHRVVGVWTSPRGYIDTGGLVGYYHPSRLNHFFVIVQAAGDEPVRYRLGHI